MKEELRPVETFTEIRPGMILVVKGCDCGKTHRGIVVSRALVAGPHGDEHGWGLEPRTSCSDDWAPGYGVCPSSVERGLLFRVVDGLELPAEVLSR